MRSERRSCDGFSRLQIACEQALLFGQAKGPRKGLVYRTSCGSAAKTIQHSHAYPASYAGYTNGNKVVELEVIDKFCLCLEAVMIKMLLKKFS